MYDEMFPADRRTALQAQALRPITPDESQAGVFQGMGTGAGTGLMSGFAKGFRNLVVADLALASVYEKVTGNSRFREQDERVLAELANPAIKFWEPEPGQVGAAGQILSAVAGLGASATMGGAAGVVANEQMNMSIDLLDKGLSPEKAWLGGVTHGMMTAAGLRLPPALGASRLSSAAIGTAVNPVIGIVDRSIVSNLLARDGLHEAAKQYAPFDPTSLAIDAAFGAIFGAALGKPRIKATPGAREAAQTVLLHEEARAGKLVRQSDVDEVTRLNHGVEAKALAGEAPITVHPDTPLDAVAVQAARERAATALRTAEREAEPDLPPPARTAVDEPPAVREARLGLEQAAADGRPLPEFLAASKIPPEAQNLMVGLTEAGDNLARAQRLIADFTATAQQTKGASLVDVSADVVEAARHGTTVTPDAAATSPEVAQARKIVAERPELEVPVGLDDQGNVVKAKATDVADEIEADLAQAKHESQAFDLAAACFLRG